MKASFLFETFYNQIGEAYLVNRPSFISELFKTGGSTHQIAETKSYYAESDYRYKLCNGSKPLSINIKRSFLNDEVNVTALSTYFEKYINKNAEAHCRALMAAFGISSDKLDITCIAMALALQFKAFIDDRENDDVDDIVATAYSRLLDEKTGVFIDQFDDIKKAPSGIEDAEVTNVEPSDSEIVDKEGINRFSVALSFAGEYRDDYVMPIAIELAKAFGSEEKILYDRFHEEELARWNLDIYLPRLYGKDSDLIVVFVGHYYNTKPWCGFEWRAIRDFLTLEENEERVMFIRIDDGELNGYYGNLDGAMHIKPTADDNVNSILKRYKRVLDAFERSSAGRAKRYPSVVVNRKTNGCIEYYPTEIANSVLERIKNQYPGEEDLYGFTQKLLDDGMDKFVCEEENLSETKVDHLVAKVLLEFSKNTIDSGDLPERTPRYLCEAINLFERDELPNDEFLSECINLKAEFYSRLDGHGNELMAELLAQDTG